MVASYSPDSPCIQEMVPLVNSCTQPLPSAFSGAVGRPTLLSKPPSSVQVSAILPMIGWEPSPSLNASSLSLAKVATLPASVDSMDSGSPHSAAFSLMA